MKYLKFAVCLAFALMLAGPVARAEENKDLSFYHVTDADLAGKPGTLIRYEPLQLFSVYRAKAYRILYRTSDMHGRTVASSGMVVVSDYGPPTKSIVAWAHPTTGVTRKCAPSLRESPIDAIAGITDLIVEGVTVVATDYPGLGTGGVTPYLSGIGEAHAVLDSVKAIAGVEAFQAGHHFALYGYSQGGHAALFAAALAKRYAPEHPLVGVAVAAPATELGVLLDDDVSTTDGKILSAMALLSWSKLYGVPLEPLVTPHVVKVMELIDSNCVDKVGSAIKALDAEGTMGEKFLNFDPNEREPWKGLLAANSVNPKNIRMPVFIAQGLDDQIVVPAVTERFAAALCKEGNPVVLDLMKDVDHGMAAKKSFHQAVRWIGERLNGKPAPSNCGG
ncbi:MAG: alpha/beta fold hydrolase [Rhizobiales bacterium]|nr:alpha/beta fold hydrolase [Hyphomicrobiales bacterium]